LARVHNGMKRNSWPLFGAVLVVLGFMGWGTDGITLNGERTVYTAACQDGCWQGTSCAGKLATGVRFRFRASKAHREVLFRTAGSTAEPAGKLSDREIQDGSNWRCRPNADLADNHPRNASWLSGHRFGRTGRGIWSGIKAALVSLEILSTHWG
jgi:hypothetical protein